METMAGEGQWTVDSRQWAEDRRQTTEGRGQRAEDRGQRADGRRGDGKGRSGGILDGEDEGLDAAHREGAAEGSHGVHDLAGLGILDGDG